VRVLLIDGDLAGARRLIDRSNRPPDIEIVHERSAKSGRRVALTPDLIDAVVAEEWLPDGRGTATLAELGGSVPHVAQILVTGVQDMTVAERATEIGVDRILSKPFEPQHLWEVIREACRDRREKLYLRDVAQHIAGLASHVPPPNELSLAVPSRLLSELTAAEVDVLKLARVGQRCKDIARSRNVAESTIRWQLRKIYSKLGVSGWHDLVRVLNGRHD